MNKEALAETLKAVPPAAVAALTLNEWVALATFAYIVVQAAYLLRKWWREERGDK
jgi:membrane protein implicated in regulation of membrane protease activity